MAKPVLELRSVGRRYGSDPPVHALREVNLVVRSGEWLAIVGPSGSGKSTLLNILGCLDVQTTGDYLFSGVDVAGLSDRSRAGLRARGIGFVFQSFHLLGHRSVLENIMLSEVYRKGASKGRRARAREALEKVNLGDRAEFLPTHLSGGERQRVAVARALMGSPRLLLCDEPTGNLDSVTTERVLQIFRDLHATGLTIVMITHDNDVAECTPRRARIIDGILKEET